MNWEMVGTLVATVAAIAAIVGLAVELRMSRVALQTDSLLRFSEQFDSDRFMRLRKRACTSLLAGQMACPEPTLVLDYFSTMGYLVDAGAISVRHVYAGFGYYIVYYWYSAAEYIRQERSVDPTMFGTLERLERRMERLLRRDGSTDASFEPEQLRTFLSEEASLPVEEAWPDQSPSLSGALWV